MLTHLIKTEFAVHDVVFYIDVPYLHGRPSAGMARIKQGKVIKIEAHLHGRTTHVLYQIMPLSGETPDYVIPRRVFRTSELAKEGKRLLDPEV